MKSIISLKAELNCFLKILEAPLISAFIKIPSFVEYKAKNKGKYTQKIDKFYPSTKKCNCCGFVNKNITLGIKEWDCPSCGQHNDRDYNAAKNIKEEGYRLFLLQ